MKIKDVAEFVQWAIEEVPNYSVPIMRFIITWGFAVPVLILLLPFKVLETKNGKM